MLKTVARSMFGTVVAALVLVLAAGPATAAPSCTRSALIVESQTATNVVLNRVDVGAAYEGDAVNIYVCSRRYGKIVLVGGQETTGDGEVWGTPVAMNARYVATAHGNGNNADGGEDSYIEVTDLKTGKLKTSSDTGGDVVAATLNSTGAVGWTRVDNEVDEFNEPSTPVTHILVRLPNGKKRPRQLIEGPSIDPEYLRWSRDGSKLIWTDDMTEVKYTRHKFKEPRQKPSKSCIRSGDRVLSTSYPAEFVSRPFSAPGWKNGRVLIACASEHQHRVAIARTGVYKGERYSIDKYTAAGVFAAVAVTRTNGDRKHTSITTFDLGRQRRVCVADASSAPGTAKVGAIAVNEARATAWTVTEAASGKRSVRFCDGGRTRTVFEGPTLDPSFIRFKFDNLLSFVTAWKSG